MAYSGNPTVNTQLIGYYDVNGYFYLPGSSQADGIPSDLLGLVHKHWYNFPPQNQMWSGLMALIYFILWIINAFGNSAVLIVIFKTKSLQTPANSFVANLAVADFLMMFTQAPLYSYNVFRSRWWSYGAFACELYGFLGGVFGVAAIFTMVAIGLDRYLVISGGISGKRITMPIAAVIILFIWAYAIAINLPPFLNVWSRFTPEGMLTTCSFDYLQEDWQSKSYVLFIFCCAYLIPLILLILFYSKIVAAVWTHEKTLKEQARKMNIESFRSNKKDQNETSVEFKIAKSALTSVFLWVSIWTPYAVVVLIAAFGDRMLITPLVSMLPALCCKFASCANPIVFAISHPRFKIALKKRFPRLYCSKKIKDQESVVDSKCTTNSIKS